MPNLLIEIGVEELPVGALDVIYDELAAKTAEELKQAIQREDAAMLIAGPSPAPIARMRGYYRYNIVLKNKDRLAICTLLKKVLASFRRPHGVLIAVDVDPVSM